jgi:hypothetical protein
MLIIILLVLLLCFGGFGISPYNRWGGYGYSPVMLILVIIMVLYLLGSFRG